MSRSPFFPLLALITLSLASAALVLGLAVTLPWLGVSLSSENGTGSDGLLVTGVAATGPAAQVLRPGDRLVSIAGAVGAVAIALEPRDILEEPDGSPNIAAMYDLFARQGQMHDILKTGATGGIVNATVLRGGEPVDLVLPVQSHRPLGDLPLVFWVQLFVGLSGVWLGGWVLALRGRDLAAAFLALAGVGLMCSSHAAALYSTRELALSDQVFALFSAINTGGSLTFGIGMICLFMVNPLRYLPHWAPLVPITVFGIWTLLSVLRLTVSTAMMIHIPILVEMLCIAIAVIGQIFATRGNPHARAALRWFGLSVTIGAGAFVGLVALPQAIGLSPKVSQGYAFALFLIIYAGLAVGVARYRLFDLEFWAFRILFYAGGVVLLLLLDAVLISAVALDRLPAFSISLLVVSFLYLPARDTLARMLGGRRPVSTEELFDLVSGVALAPGGSVQRVKLHGLLTALFQPLEISRAPEPVDVPTLSEGGAVMDLPGIDATESTRMRWAHRGRRLFSLRDLNRAAAVLSMTAQFIERRRAYEAGADEERRRINRDMHDNIGVQLLGALHSGESARKDALIRQTLTDLRDIVSNVSGRQETLAELLGDMRAELSEHLMAADIALDWTETDLPEGPLKPHTAGALRAILREAAGNILRHSDARRASVAVVLRPRPGGAGHLVVTVTDDGLGPGERAKLSDGPNHTAGHGNGLRNLRDRTQARGGEFSFGPGPNGHGSRLCAVLALGADGDDMALLRWREAGE